MERSSDYAFPRYLGCEDGFLMWDEVESDSGVVGRTIKEMSLAELSTLYSDDSLETTKITFLRQLLTILVRLNEAEIIHRDIKPENILYDASTRSLKVIDFGSAKVSEQDKTKKGATSGAQRRGLAIMRGEASLHSERTERRGLAMCEEQSSSPH